MAKSYGAEEARQQLPRLLEQAHAGTPAIITRHGRAYAAIVPVEQVAPRRRGMSLLALRGTGKGLWTGDDSISSQRDEWR